MELEPYVDAVRHELAVAAAAGGEDARALADRLSAPLESSIRLAILEALSAAAEEITRDLAPGSVRVQLRGRDPAFSVATVLDGSPEETPAVPIIEAGDDGGTWRVTLRMPEYLRPGVESAARRDGHSVNAWLVRAVTSALGPGQQTPSTPSHATDDKNFSGWVR